MSFAAPDKDGFVEIYVSPHIGDGVSLKTNFRVNNETTSASFSGASGEPLDGLTVGDVDENNCISITDATLLQLFISNTVEFRTNTLAQRRNDANGDGVINISDATAIQKYLVKKII